MNTQSEAFQAARASAYSRVMELIRDLILDSQPDENSAHGRLTLMEQQALKESSAHKKRLLQSNALEMLENLTLYGSDATFAQFLRSRQKPTNEELFRLMASMRRDLQPDTAVSDKSILSVISGK